MLAHEVVGREFGGVHCDEVDAVGIEPDVYFHASFVGFLDGPVERVPYDLFAPCPLCAGEPMTDGFVGTIVEGICGRAHLQDDGVDADRGEGIEDEKHLRLLCLRVADRLRGRPIDVGDCSDPGSFERDLCSRLNKEQRAKNKDYYVTQFAHFLRGKSWHFRWV